MAENDVNSESRANYDQQTTQPINMPKLADAPKLADVPKPVDTVEPGDEVKSAANAFKQTDVPKRRETRATRTRASLWEATARAETPARAAASAKAESPAQAVASARASEQVPLAAAAGADDAAASRMPRPARASAGPRIIPVHADNTANTSAFAASEQAAWRNARAAAPQAKPAAQGQPSPQTPPTARLQSDSPAQPAAQSQSPAPARPTSSAHPASPAQPAAPAWQAPQPQNAPFSAPQPGSFSGGHASTSADFASAAAAPTAPLPVMGAVPPAASMPADTAASPAAPAFAKKAAKTPHGPGWAAAIAMSVIAALVGGGIGIGGNEALRPATSVSSSASTEASKPVAPVVESTGEAPNWQKVQQAVGNTVVAIDTRLEDGSAAGSGVIIDTAGHVLTNDHVISGGTDIYVTLADGRLFKAKVAGTDEATDLAVLTITNPPKDLTAATLGDSAALHVGQDVAAIGNPLGLSSTMTTGIISALNRPVTTQKESEMPNPFAQRAPGGPEVVTNAIQLDAAVNPGNSGGPVFDSAGRVIGIASSIATMSGGSARSGSIGLGFAIPIDLAKNVSAQLIKNGVAEHAFLGVTIVDGGAQYDGITRLGAEINSVSAGTPAAKAGLEKGDVIIKIAGNDVSGATSLTGFVRQYASGDVVTLTLERDGKLLDVDVTLATRQDQ